MSAPVEPQPTMWIMRPHDPEPVPAWVHEIGPVTRYRLWEGTKLAGHWSSAVHSVVSARFQAWLDAAAAHLSAASSVQPAQSPEKQETIMADTVPPTIKVPFTPPVVRLKIDDNEMPPLVVSAVELLPDGRVSLSYNAAPDVAASSPAADAVAGTDTPASADEPA